MSSIVFDTEATDIVPGQICQLSYLILEAGTLKAKNFFFSVDEMNPDAQEVHGMSMEDLDLLSKQRVFADDADEIYQDFLKAKLLIGHNVSADDRYLRTEFDRLGLKLPKINTFCTMNFASGIMNLARRIPSGRPKPPKLSELAEYYGVSEEQTIENSNALFGDGAHAHDARFDTVMTYLCLCRSIEKGDLKGMTLN